MIAKALQPSQRAFEHARKIARYAVKHDHWMCPIDEWNEPEATTDYGVFEQELIHGWEETCQFQMLHGRCISDLAEQQAKRFGINKHDGGCSWDLYYYSLYCPLRDEFWEEWCLKQNLLKFWNENVEGK